MTLDVTLLVGLGALALLVGGLLRTTRDLQRRVDDLQSALDRSRALARRGAPAASPAGSPAASPAAPADEALPAAGDAPAAVPAPVAVPVPAPAGDDDALPALVGTTASGDAVTVPLDDEAPTLVAFLSTTCSICVGVWRRLSAGELEELRPGARAVVVTKDAGVEDAAAVQGLDTGPGATVVMSSEAWDDYEVPGSPYFLVVDGRPADVVTEGSAQGWGDVAAMVRRTTSAGA